jgi:hypothetical protein
LDAIARAGVRTVCARPRLLASLEEALPPLPFAMCFSAAEERPGGVLALPNGFLKTLVAKRYRDHLDRYAASAGFGAIEIVVDPRVSVVVRDEADAPFRPETLPPAPGREQPPGLTTRLFAERSVRLFEPRAP